MVLTALGSGAPLDWNAYGCAHTLLNCVATVFDAEGMPLHTVHHLRHTRGTARTEHGQRLDIVQRVLGHKDPRSTQLYADIVAHQVR